MYRRVLLIVLGLLVASALAACGASTQTAPSAAQPTAAAATEPTAVPAAVSTAAPAAEPTAASGSGAATAAPSSANTGNLRTFKIVPEQSEASYEVQEQFLSRDAPNKAVGKTNAVSGELQFSLDGKPTGQVTKITVDLSKLQSDSSRRDGAIRQRWLESDKYPLAEFVSTEVQGAPESYTEGQDITFKLVGNLTIREVTKPVTFDVTGKLQGDTITGTATTQILMKDFGFDPPNVAGILTVKDGVTVNVTFTAKEAQ